MKRTRCIGLAIPLFVCAGLLSWSCSGKSPWAPQLQEIQCGINRGDFERQLGSILKKKSHYDAYLQAAEPEAHYALDDEWELIARFEPAALWREGDRVFPPRDSKVLDFTIRRTGKKTSARSLRPPEPEEAIRAALEGIRKDLRSLQCPRLRNLQRSCIRNTVLYYDNGRKEKGAGPFGRDDEISYSLDYCHLKVAIDYPSGFSLSAPVGPNGIPELFGTVRGKPFAAWVELTESEANPEFHEVLKTVVDARLDELRMRLGFEGRSFIADIRDYLIANATTIKIETLPMLDDTGSRSYILNKTKSPDSGCVFIRFISDTPDTMPASYYTTMLQPGLYVGEVSFLENGRNLLNGRMKYEILESNRRIGTVEFSYHNRQYFYRLTDDGYKYLDGK
jgi:hypothetical protein